MNAIRRFWFWGCILGVGLGYFAFKEFRLSQVAGQTPQAITCSALAANGPGDNAHVTMNDFHMLTGSYVYQGKENSAKWERVWVPAVGFDHPWVATAEAAWAQAEADGADAPPDIPDPKTFTVIVRAEDVAGETGVGRMAAEDALTGLVVNEVESLGRKERKLLEESYPGVDFDKCWILDVGREPKGGMTAILIGACALALFAFGLWLKFGGQRG